jgi:hypothetical protein
LTRKRDIDIERKALKWFLKKQGLGVWAVFFCHRICVILGPSEHGNSPLVSSKEREYFGKNSNLHFSRVLPHLRPIGL